MRRTRFKVCGITRVEDAQLAAELGADAIGLVFYAASPRAVTPAQAAAIVAGLPPFVTVTGLFVDATAEQIRTTLQNVPLDLLQFHGDESATDCEQYDRPYIKAIAMSDGVDLAAAAIEYGSAQALLLDSSAAGQRGGTGISFDWRRVPGDLALPVIVAGGLHAGNVAEAIRIVRPWAVDVSSGVEAARGIKDADRMVAFAQEISRVQR